MSQSEPWTIGRLLTWTTDYLKQHGSDSPRLDAEVLLAEARGCKRIELYTAFAENADEPTRTAFRELVRRRAEGTPVAYLVGKREFYSLSFRVTPDVLIPRPKQNRWLCDCSTWRRTRHFDDRGTVEQRIDYHARILDVGTGSGIIAICAAKHLAEARVTAIDSSTAALAVARNNAADHGVADRIEFIESDLLSALPAEQKFNIIASNPPYVSEAEFATLSPSVRRLRTAASLGGRPARHRGDRAPRSASGRTFGTRRLVADRSESDDRTGCAGNDFQPRPLRTGPHHQRFRRPPADRASANEIIKPAMVSPVPAEFNLPWKAFR